MNLAGMLGIGVIISFALKNVNSISGATGMMSKLFTEARNGHQVLSNLGKAMVAVAAAAALMKAGMAGINATMGNVQAYADYETEMAHVQGLLNVSREEMKVLEDQATALSLSTRFTRGEIMQAYWELISAGFDVTQVMEMINGTLMVSVSGSMETAEAVHVLTSAILGFGFTAEDTMKVLDQLQTGIRYTKIHWEDYAASLGRFSATAAATNQELAESAAMFGLIMSRGLPAARSATLYRVALSELMEMGSKPEALAALSGAGVEMLDARTGEFRHLADIFDDINKAFPALSELPESVMLDEGDITDAAFARMGLLGDILGRRGVAAFYAVTTASQQLNGSLFEGVDVLRELTRLMAEESSGAMEGYYSIMLTTFNEKMAIIKSSWVTLREQLGAPLVAAISPILDHVNNALTVVSEFLTAHPEVAKAIGSALAIGAALLLVAGVFAGIVAVIAIVAAIGKGAIVIALIVVAVIASVVGIIALIVAGILLYGNQIYNWIKTRIWPILSVIIAAIVIVYGIIGAIFATLVLPFLGIIVAGLLFLWNVFDSILVFISGVITGDIGGAIETIKGIWSTFATDVENIITFFVGLIDDVWLALQKIADWVISLTSLGEGNLEQYVLENPLTPVNVAGTEGFAYDPSTIMMGGFATGSDYIPRDGLYHLHEGEGVTQTGSRPQQAPVSLSIGEFNINIDSSGSDSIDGEKIGRIALEYMNENLSRVMA